MTDHCLSWKKMSETLRLSYTECFCLQAGTAFLAEEKYKHLDCPSNTAKLPHLIHFCAAV